MAKLHFSVNRRTLDTLSQCFSSPYIKCGRPSSADLSGIWFKYVQMFSCKLFKTNVWLGLCARIFWFSNFHFQRTENMGSRESYLSPSNVHTLLENKWNVAETEILHELAHYTTRISSWHSDFRVVSWTNSCSISVFPLYFIAFFTLHVYTPLLRGDFYTVYNWHFGKLSLDSKSS